MHCGTQLWHACQLLWMDNQTRLVWLVATYWWNKSISKDGILLFKLVRYSCTSLVWLTFTHHLQNRRNFLTSMIHNLSYRILDRDYAPKVNMLTEVLDWACLSYRSILIQSLLRLKWKILETGDNHRWWLLVILHLLHPHSLTRPYRNWTPHDSSIPKIYTALRNNHPPRGAAFYLD